MDIARTNTLGRATYDKLDIGDLVSWKELSITPSRQYGVVLEKYITLKDYRNMCMLKVASTRDNKIYNILAIIVKIESKNTT